MPYFVVISEQGPAWTAGRPMREQGLWAEHAAFMNALADKGFVVLGGPLRDPGVHRARLIVKAASEAVARERLGADPWARAGLLRLASVEEWEVLLGKED